MVGRRRSVHHGSAACSVGKLLRLGGSLRLRSRWSRAGLVVYGNGFKPSSKTKLLFWTEVLASDLFGKSEEPLRCLRLVNVSAVEYRLLLRIAPSLSRPAPCSAALRRDGST
jgi:hypothetical protein